MDPALAQAISTIAGALAVLILAIASRIRRDDDPDSPHDWTLRKRRRRREEAEDDE